MTASSTATPRRKRSLSKKSAAIDIDFSAGRTTVLELERIAESSPVELRPDLGIGHGDVRVTADAIEVTVHSLGHADAPAGFVVLEDARVKELARVGFPSLEAPRDLVPKTAVAVGGAGG
ncbi:hypothetical protein AN651_08935 [Xanthomonas arboricola]|nr:hypothetical protein AN651_08935 [Xanthomonas arboricola]